MKTRSVPFLVLALPLLAHAQPANPGVLIRNAAIVELDSIDPDNHDFADLQPLKALIGDARVVALGEQSHGDGAVFLCKARLIAFLHEEMGFDVLAWESGIVPGLEANERIADPDVPIVDSFAGVFEIWTWSRQVRPVLEYARSTHETDRPLIQAGFDSQMTGTNSGDQIGARIDALTLDGDERPAEVDRAVDHLTRMGEADVSEPDAYRALAADIDAAVAWIDANRQALDERSTPREVALTRRSADDAAWFCRMIADQKEKAEFDVWERDRRMGSNIAFLANEYFPDKKIILWAATSHLTHNPEQISFPANHDAYSNKTDTAGEGAFRALGDDLYTIGFTAIRGDVGNVFAQEGWSLPDPETGSIEWALGAIAHPFLYLDFRSLPDGHALRERQNMRPLGYAPMEAVWPDQMDAVICIETMIKSDQRIDRPDGYTLTVGLNAKDAKDR
jgi:erythromycin esterase